MINRDPRRSPSTPESRDGCLSARSLTLVRLAGFAFPLVPVLVLAQTGSPAPVATPAPAASPAGDAGTADALSPEAVRAIAPSVTADPTDIPFADADEPMEVLEDTIRLIEDEYVEDDITREELVEAALRGMIDHLNRRAARAGRPAANSLLSRREMGRLTDALSGEATGIGVYARPSEGGLEVLRVFAGSPAGKAGLKAGDRIAAIDEQPVSGLEAFALLRGRDGVPVRLQVVRDTGPEARPIEVRVTRSRYRIPTVESFVVDGNVGYLRIGKFTRGSGDDVAGALLEFQNAPGPRVWGVVLDLSGNPGGSLQEATRIAEMFVEPGRPLLQIQTKRATQVVSAAGEVLWTGPVTVLVDGGTASAAEALAAALQSNKRALLVGERTAGRGLGESVFTLPTGGALRIATARYLTPTGDSWIGEGLLPDVQVLPAPLDPTDPLAPPLRNALTIMQPFRPANQTPDDPPPFRFGN